MPIVSVSLMRAPSLSSRPDLTPIVFGPATIRARLVLAWARINIYRYAHFLGVLITFSSP